MDDLLHGVEQDVLPSQQTNVYQTLAKVLGNIMQNPAEFKYRTLKKENKIVTETLGKSPSAISLLLTVGFEDTGATYTCPAAVNLDPMQEALELLECILLSRGDDTRPAPKTEAAAEPLAAAPAVAPVSTPVLAAPAALAPTTTSNKTGTNNFVRRSEAEKSRSDQTNQLEAVRAAQKLNHSDAAAAPGYGAAPAAAAPAAAGYPAAQAASTHKKVESAFDFKSRAKEEKKQTQAVQSLEEIRRLQKEKFKEFQSDPNAGKSEAYQRPASVAGQPNGKQEDQSWGTWASGWFGGGSSSGGGGGSGSGGGGGQNERRGPNIKGVGDLPKPVQRGG